MVRGDSNGKQKKSDMAVTTSLGNKWEEVRKDCRMQLE